MRIATLIVNPSAGRARVLTANLAAILTLLADEGYRAEVVETSAEDGSAWRLAAEAAKGSALVIACGGDGTVHGVVQGLAQTQVVLGIVPVGTANALARNLKLPLDPLAAVRRLMTYHARAVPLGRIAGAGGTRWFCLMAGCGPAGALVDAMARGSALKKRFGRIAYYAHAARLFLTRSWPRFRAEFCPAGEEWQSLEAVAVMACWVPDLGGLFSGVTHKASVMDGRLHVQIVRGPAWLSLPAWMLFGARGPWVKEVDAEELRWMPIGVSNVYVQADAEPMGILPVEVCVVPAAILMLMPEAGGLD
jgi:diacylglycerol kinase family enzyme